MNYPFTAIVGQEKLKKALLLCAINPGIGGLLIQGDKGTAKSTAARALAEVVPHIQKTVNCQFNCTETQPASDCEVCAAPDKKMEAVPVPFINLPIGATEERIIGSLDLEGILVGKKKKFQPGLLAAVHQGILYIDEVNLLPDHLVDVLLDVAAMGENNIEREGFSLSHPSRFTLVGTMNPEEGKLRPQFLDRFGLMINVEAPGDIKERAEVVRRRIAFEKDPTAFVQQWELNQKELKHQLSKAMELLPAVHLHDDLLHMISQLTTELNVKSLRADIVIYKTAVTLAALEQRTVVNADDITEAAVLALGHRSRKPSSSPPPPSPQKGQSPSPPDKGPEAQPQPSGPEQHQSGQPSASAEAEGESGKQSSGDEVFEPGAPVTLPAIDGLIRRGEQFPSAGKRAAAAGTARGAYIRPEVSRNAADLAANATVVHALQRNPFELDITLEDLHQKKRNGKVSNLILFVVDASGSMAAGKRMAAVKGTVLSLLEDAYQKRDAVGVIAFRGIEAQVLLEPTRSIEQAEEAMRTLPTGGRTPLPHAIQAAATLLDQFNGRNEYHPLLVILTDGKANVAIDGEGDPWHQTLTLAALLKQRDIQSLVVNTESNFFNLNKAEELAGTMGAQYISLHDISGENLTPVIHQFL